VVGRSSDRLQPILNISAQLMGSFVTRSTAASAVVVISNADSRGSSRSFRGAASEPGLLASGASQAKPATGLPECAGDHPLRFDADWAILLARNTAASEASGAEALSGLARALFLCGRAVLVGVAPESRVSPHHQAHHQSARGTECKSQDRDCG
jgi:hypothetical protein